MLPTENRTLPHQPAGFDTLSEALDYAAAGETGVNFYSSLGILDQVLTYSELRERAIAVGLRLRGMGLSRGDRVAIIAETGPDFLSVFYGCQYVGLVPCPLPYTAYMGGRDSYVSRLAGLATSSAADILCTPENLGEIADDVSRRSGIRCTTFQAIMAGAPTGQIEPSAPDDIAYIQFSSGSTARPKGIPVTQKAVSANAFGIARQALELKPHDRAFSWLPLYHDMGLVGFSIVPLSSQSSVDYLSASAFARRPNLWIKLMSANGTTITYAPTFGYQLAAQRFDQATGPVDLSRLRVAGIGGDMIRPDVLETYASIMSAHGFDAGAFTPSYGMAESTLAITFAHGVRVDRVDRRACISRQIALPVKDLAASDGEVREFVVCGQPLDGHELQVVQNGQQLQDRHIGHVLVRGPSLMQGYDRDAEATEAVMRSDGFMDTGDLGYMIDGEVVITGRSKDLVLHRGRNIWPEDIEWTAEAIARSNPGSVAAFGIENIDGEEEIILLVECKLGDPSERETLCRNISAAISETVGAACKIVLVAPKTLKLTSSGKLMRSAAREEYITGIIRPIETLSK